MIDANVSPSRPRDAQPTIGLIGMGAMGRMYAQILSEAGWLKIHVCDLPSKHADLVRDYADQPNITPLPDGHAVSRSSDFIMYSVEAKNIDEVVRHIDSEEPWTDGTSSNKGGGLYVGGIETAKVNLVLRIYSNLWHVYAGLAILNPSARIQINQYAKSATELFKLMLSGGSGAVDEAAKLRKRIEWGREVVFGHRSKGNSKERKPILLSQEVLDRFSLGKMPDSVPPSPSEALFGLAPPSKYRPNSHLSLLAMVDCWAHLGINPYEHLALAATPIFRLFLGVAEHLFLSPSLLGSAIQSGLFDNWHRSDDLEFVVAAKGWSQCVSFGNFDLYEKRFEETRLFFEGRFEEANKLGSEMIKAIMETEVLREEEEAKD
ncbi:hypothetical protein C0993_009511 [Termitomyces sp. T159_Od127]|nr:hypothetical protein C0993_009511 [Termitomyces sp. T159_Od127]